MRFGLDLVYEGFTQTSTDRQLGFNGEGDIPWSVIMEYADRKDIYDLDEREQFLRFIRAMDRKYLEVRKDQSEKKSKQ